MAFDVPNLPTESLHKFKAVAGLILIFGSYFYFIVACNDLKTDIISAETELSVLKVKSASLNHVIVLDSAYIDFLRKTNEKIHEADVKKLIASIEHNKELDRADSIAPLEKRMEKYFAIREKIVNSNLARREKLSALAIAAAQIQGKGALMLLHVRLLAVLTGVCIIAGLTGLRIAYSGFRSWSKVQNDIDDALRKGGNPATP
jgi:hypothetical protein